VASQSSVKDVFAQIQKEFEGKKLAAAVFNVGGAFVRKPFLSMSLEEYESGFNANGYGYFSDIDRKIPKHRHCFRSICSCAPC
jgi:hypothetical protein